jgi:hypothetical protein
MCVRACTLIFIFYTVVDKRVHCHQCMAHLRLQMHKRASWYGGLLLMYCIISSQPIRDGHPALGFGRGQQFPTLEKSACCKMLHMASDFENGELEQLRILLASQVWYRSWELVA